MRQHVESHKEFSRRDNPDIDQANCSSRGDQPLEDFKLGGTGDGDHSHLILDQTRDFGGVHTSPLTLSNPTQEQIAWSAGQFIPHKKDTAEYVVAAVSPVNQYSEFTSYSKDEPGLERTVSDYGQDFNIPRPQAGDRDSNGSVEEHLGETRLSGYGPLPTFTYRNGSIGEGSGNSQMVPFIFEWEHPATEVFVTGTFDDWFKTILLDEVGDVFAKEILLPLSTEKIYYKFVVDGYWTLNANAAMESDNAGNLNIITHEQLLAAIASPMEIAKSRNTGYTWDPDNYTVAFEKLRWNASQWIHLVQQPDPEPGKVSTQTPALTTENLHVSLPSPDVLSQKSSTESGTTDVTVPDIDSDSDDDDSDLSSDPDIYDGTSDDRILDPKIYFAKLRSLEQEVFENSGIAAFKRGVSLSNADDDQFICGSNSSGSLSGARIDTDCVLSLIKSTTSVNLFRLLESYDLMVLTCRSLRKLQEAGYCASHISILVRDGDRIGVAKLIQTEIDTILKLGTSLENLLRDVISIVSAVPYNSASQDVTNLAKTTISALSDIWGPSWKIIRDSEPGRIQQVDIGNGAILPRSIPMQQSEAKVETHPSELFCHWISFKNWNSAEIEETLACLPRAYFVESDVFLGHFGHPIPFDTGDDSHAVQVQGSAMGFL
ncbi:hypothetical protein BKA61DRAFT_667610 [Leptodontidium sp. MPI-SDFR-AT-0119]|nr:hypothetical protein BKA61DRAFT_667610 [Leptodontidium sp. MPI-SDFR-AT-0119]